MKGALRNFEKFTGKHLCQSLLFNKVFSYEFCEISKNTFLTEEVRATAYKSATSYIFQKYC